MHTRRVNTATHGAHASDMIDRQGRDVGVFERDLECAHACNLGERIAHEAIVRNARRKLRDRARRLFDGGAHTRTRNFVTWSSLGTTLLRGPYDLRQGRGVLLARGRIEHRRGGACRRWGCGGRRCRRTHGRGTHASDRLRSAETWRRRRRSHHGRRLWRHRGFGRRHRHGRKRAGSHGFGRCVAAVERGYDFALRFLTEVERCRGNIARLNAKRSGNESRPLRHGHGLITWRGRRGNRRTTRRSHAGCA